VQGEARGGLAAAAWSGVLLSPSLVQPWLFFIPLRALGFGGTPALPGALASSPCWVLVSGVRPGLLGAGQPGWDALVLNFVFLTPRLRGGEK